MVKKGRRSSIRPRVHPLTLILLAIVGAYLLLGIGGDMKTPDLTLPEGVARDKQMAHLMREHIVHRGWQPVHSFVLYAENQPEGILIHQGVGTVGRNDTPVNADYQYNIASITKPIVATLILQLMEEGKLALDDPAAMYLREIDYLQFDELHILDGKSYADRITIDHLLQHRTGLGDIFIDTATRFNVSVLLHPRRQYSPKRIMETFFAYNLNERPHFKPGEGYYYTDINYVLLGLVIEQITGESLPDQIRQRVLEPLTMDATYFEFYEAERGSGKRMDSYLGPLNMTRYINTSYEWAGGGLVSTAEDMATYIQALFEGTLFERESTLPLMLDNAANQADGETYARGINHYTLDGETYYGHGGFYGSLLLYHPQKRVTLSAHLAQANAPYDVEPSIAKILESIEAR